MIIKQLSVFVENKSGRVAEVVDVLRKNGVDMLALSLADTADFGIVRVIVDKQEVAEQALREAGVVCKSTDVLAVHLEHKAGALAAVLDVLSKAEMPITYMYASVGRQTGQAMMIFRVDNPQVAANLLIGKGFSAAL